MQKLTSPWAGPISVRDWLLKTIGRREDGVSWNELSMEIRRFAGSDRVPAYGEVLAALILDRRVSLSFCGTPDYQVQVYALCSPWEEDSSKNRPRKQCYRCKRFIDISAFRVRTDSKDGRTGQCRMCENRHRKLNGCRKKSRKNAQEGKETEATQAGLLNDRPNRFPTQEEVDAAMVKVKAQSLEEYRKKTGGGLYIDVNGRAVPSEAKVMGPVELYDRTWKRIQAK